MKYLFKKYIRIIIALAALVWLYRSGLFEINKLKDLVAKPTIMISGLVLFTLQFLTFSCRFKTVISIQKEIPLAKAFKLHLIGQFFNMFIPGGVGGDVIKAIELGKTENISNKQTLAYAMLDRIMGLYSMIFFSCIFLITKMNSLDDHLIQYLYISITLLAITSTALFARKKIAYYFNQMTQPLQISIFVKIKNTLDNVFSFLNLFFHKSLFIRFVFTSFLAQCFAISFLYIVTHEMVSVDVPFSLFFPLACFAFMAMSIPITPGGIGVGQAAFYFIFRPISEPVAESVILGVSLMQFFYIIISLPGLYLFSQLKKKVNPIQNSSS